ETSAFAPIAKVVVVSLIANVAIAVCKYIAAVVSSSPAMLSEAFHSTADTGNELLLLLGMHRSRRPRARGRASHPAIGPRSGPVDGKSEISSRCKSARIRIDYCSPERTSSKTGPSIAHIFIQPAHSVDSSGPSKAA